MADEGHPAEAEAAAGRRHRLLQAMAILGHLHGMSHACNHTPPAEGRSLCLAWVVRAPCLHHAGNIRGDGRWQPPDCAHCSSAVGWWQHEQAAAFPPACVSAAALAAGPLLLESASAVPPLASGHWGHLAEMGTVDLLRERKWVGKAAAAAAVVAAEGQCELAYT